MTEKHVQPRTLAECRQGYDELVRDLTRIGFIWPGTLQFRTLTCGQKRCACTTNKRARHGPYFYWTSKKKGKTVSRKIDQEEAVILESWIHNRRLLHATLKEMAKLSEQALILMMQSKETGG